MAQIGQLNDGSLSRRSTTSVSAGRRGSSGKWLARAITTVVAISPIPFGSNRPIFWGMSAVAIGLIGFTYLIGKVMHRAPLRVGLKELWVSAVLFGLVCVYLLVQIAPLDGLIPLSWRDASNVEWHTRTISLAPGDTALMLLRWLSYGATFFLVAQISPNRERARGVLRTLLVVVTAYAVLALFSLTQLGDTYLGLPKPAYLGSATGTFINRNSFATFLCFGLVIGTALFLDGLLQAKPRVERLRTAGLTATALAILMIALFATNSRMGLATGLVAGTAVLIMGASKVTLGARAWIGATLLLAALLAAGFFALGEGVLLRVVHSERDADFRALLYSQVWDMIRARPFLGFGGGTFDAAFPMFHRAPLTSDARFDKAHSTYLALWAELGLFFGTIPILAIVAAALRAFKAFNRSSQNWVIGVAALGAVVVAAIHSTVDFSLEMQANAYLFVTIVALAASPGSGAPREAHLRNIASSWQSARR